MKFEVAFPQRMQCSVTGTGLFLCAAGGQMVWRKDMDRINTYELDTLHVTLTIEDANADYGEWAGFRKVLKMHGVL